METKILHEPEQSTVVDRQTLTNWLDGSLQPTLFRDYCPNGLQVEGKPSIGTLVCGVTASADFIDAAIAAGADAILVHHGWFWKNEDRRVVGWRRARMASVVKNDLNLFAYHLPLDAHAQYGNNAQLASILGLEALPERFGEQSLGWLGMAPGCQTVGDLAERVQQRLGRTPIVVGNRQQSLGRIGWCTGGAQSWFESALDAGATAYLSGEISEPNAHLARETGYAYLACGHHATERYGVQALGRAAAQALGLRALFIDIDNPA